MRHTGLVLSLSLALGCAPVEVGSDAPASDAPIDAGADAGAGDAGANDVGASDVGGAATLDACFAGLSPRVTGRTVNVIDFSAEGGAVRVRLAREIGDRTAVGETFAYDLVRLGVEQDGEVVCLTAPASLAYDYGHHNWNDLATGTGARVYEIRMIYDVETGGWDDTLQIDGSAPIELTEESCTSLPTFDINHCLLRDDA